MKRRDFFKGMIGVGAAVVVAPLIAPDLLAQAKKEELPVSTPVAPGKDMQNTSNDVMTQDFLKYLKSHKKDLKFDFRPMTLPSGLMFYMDKTAKDAISIRSEPIMAASYKLKTKYSPELEDLQAYHPSINAERELEDLIFGGVVEQLNDEQKNNMLYIYKLMATPAIFPLGLISDSPTAEDFIPRRGLILRMAIRKQRDDWKMI